MANFPGQTDTLVFNLDQVKVLASPGTNEIFWAFSGRTPKSAREVAESMGKRAPAVHYHVAILVEHGLLIGVEERKRYARTETLYVRSGVRCVDNLEGASEEYLGYRIKSFAATMREISRQTELLYELSPHKPDVWDFEHYQRTFANLSAEQAAYLKAKLEEITREVIAMPNDPEGTRVNVTLVMRPTIDQARTWKEDLGLSNSEEAE